MKKVVLLTLLVLLICGCESNENSLVKSDYINKNSYSTIYNDLSKIVNDVSYIPSKEVERNFYEMIEVISDNCNKFSIDELTNLERLININYQFKYSGDNYTNDDYQNDLSKIKTCLAE